MSNAITEDIVLDFDNWLGGQPPEIRHGIDAHLKASGANAGRAKKELANMFAVSDETGLDLRTVNDNWSTVRGGYAEKQGGDWLAVKDDEEAFNGRLVQHVTKQKDVRIQSDSFAAAGAAAAVKMQPDDLLEGSAALDEMAGKVEGMGPAEAARFKASYLSARSKMEAQVGPYRPVAKTIAGLLKVASGKDEQGTTDLDLGYDPKEKALDLIMELPPEGREAVVRMIASEGASDTRGAVGKQAESGMRGLTTQLRGFAGDQRRAELLRLQSNLESGNVQVAKDMSLQEGFQDLLTGKPRGKKGFFSDRPESDFLRPATPEEVAQLKAMTDKALARNVAAGQVADLIDTAVDPLKARNYFEKIALNASNSLGMMAPIAIPGAGVVLAQGGYADQEFQRQVGLGTPVRQAHEMAQVTGALQAGMERAAFLFNFAPESLLGKLTPKFSTPSLATSRLANIGLKGGAIQASEYAEEIAQAAAPSITAAMADSFGWTLNEKTNFEAESKNWKLWDPETYMTVAALSMFGGGMAGLHQTAQTKAALIKQAADPVALEAIGIKPLEAELISQMPENERLAAFKEAYARREPDSEHAKAASTEIAQRAEVAKSSAQESLDAAGIAAVRRTDAGWEVERDDGTKATVESAEAAQAMVHGLNQAADAREAEALFAIADTYHEENKGRASTTFTGAVAHGVKEGVTYIRRGEVVKEIKDEASLRELYKEATMEGAEDVNVLVNGSNRVFTERVGEGARQVVKELEVNRSASNVVTLLHEQVEANLKEHLGTGQVTTTEMMSALNFAAMALPESAVPASDAEGKAFRQRVMRGAMGEASDTEMRETVVELAVADTLGRRKDGGYFPAGSISAALNASLQSNASAADRAAVGKFRALLRAVRAYLRGVMGTVAGLRKARRDGKLADGNALDALIDKITGEAVRAKHNAAVLKAADAKAPPMTGSRAVPADPNAPAFEMPDGAVVIGPTTFSVRAYHGTAHKVDRFTIDKIGTGEGRQMYGWGLYMTATKDVAEGYAHRLSGPSYLSAAAWQLGKDAIALARKEGASGKGIISRANEILTEKAQKIDPAYPRDVRTHYDAANNLPEIYKGGGNVYTVDLLPDAEQFLDYDKPLSEQSDYVKAALLKANAERDFELDQEDLKLPGSVAYGTFNVSEGSPKAASEHLLKHGIPGIRYLDGNSRDSGEGTSNYVIFDGDLVKILEENGKPVEQEQDSGRSFSVTDRGRAREWITQVMGNRHRAADEFAAMKPDIVALAETKTKREIISDRLDRLEDKIRDGNIIRDNFRDSLFQVDYFRDARWTYEEKSSIEKALDPFIKSLEFKGSTTAKSHEWRDIEHNRIHGRSSESSNLSFSLSSVSTLEAVAAQIENRMAGAPEQKVEVLSNLARTLNGMARAARYNEETERVLAAGQIETKRRGLRQELLDQYTIEVLESPVGAALGSDLSLRDSVVIGQVLDLSRKGLHGVFLAPSKARKQGRQLAGEYDDAAGVPGWMFHGERTPDQVATSLGMDVTEMWAAIHDELASNDRMREYEAAARRQMAEAKVKATQNAAAWASKERAKLAQSDSRDAKRALIALDSMILQLPAAVRKSVGGFAPLSELTTNKAREAYFLKAVDRIDRALETHLRNEFKKDIINLFDRARAKMNPGTGDRGKLGVNGHAWFQRAEEISKLSPQALAEREAFVESRISGAEELTDAEATDLNRVWDFGGDRAAAAIALEQEQALLDLFGGMNHSGPDGKPLRSSGELEAAYKAALDALRGGRAAWEAQIVDRRTWRIARKMTLQHDVGTTGTPAAIAARERELQGFGGSAQSFFHKGFTFEQLIGDIAGRESATHKYAERSVLNATVKEKSEWMDRQQEFVDLTHALWPRTSSVGILKNLEALAIPKKVPGAPEEMPEMSQLEAVNYTMLWADVDSRNWLVEWGFGDDAQAAMEAWLTPEAKEIRSWLQGRYDEQYDEINEVYRRLYGVNMPRVAMYTPREVLHGSASTVADPLNPGAAEGRGVFAGFTKRRRPVITSQPIQRDALSAYWMNQRVTGHWRAWAEPMRELRALFSTNDTQPFIQAAAGKEAGVMVNQWLTDLEANGYREGMTIRQLQAFMSANAKNALVGKIGVLAKQLPAAYGAAAEIGWGEYMKSVKRIASGDAVMSFREMGQTDLIQQRLWQDKQIVQQAAKGSGMRLFDRALRKIGVEPHAIDLAIDYLGGFIGRTDAYFTTLSATAAYDAKYRQAIERGETEADARAEAMAGAESVVARTAQPDSLAGKSQYENRAGQWARMMFAFQSANRQALFATFAAFRDGGIKSGKAWEMAVTHWAITGIVTQLVGNIARTALSGGDPEDIWEAGDFARAAAIGPLTGALYFGPLVDAIGGLMGGFERKQAPGVAGFIGDVGHKAIKIMTDETVSLDAKSLDMMVRALGITLGSTVSSRASALNVAANLIKQVGGIGDRAVLTDEEEIERKAAKQRKADKEKRKEIQAAVPDEVKEAKKAASEAAKAAKLRLDASRYDANQGEDN